MTFRTPPSTHTLLLRHLAIAARAGTALDIVPAKLAQDPALTRSLRLQYKDAANALAQGHTLSHALRSIPSLLTTPGTQWLAIAEEVGDISSTLDAMANDLELQSAAGASLGIALVWPTCLGVVACIVFAVMAIFVMPSFHHMFESMGLELPGITSLVFGDESSSTFIRICIPIVLVLLLGSALAIAYEPNLTPRWLTRTAYRMGVTRRLHHAEFVTRVLNLVDAKITHQHGRSAALAYLEADQSVPALARSASSMQSAISSGASWSHAIAQQSSLAPVYAISVELGELSHDASASAHLLKTMAHTEWRDALVRFERNVSLGIYAIVVNLVAALLFSVYLPIFQLGKML